MTDALEIIAHRGASHDAPENTVAAATLGFAQGADAVECDIRLSRDGRIVVIHDDSTKRTTGVEGAVKETAFDALRALDAGRWKGPAFAGERIPTLDEILSAVPAGKRLVIEIKCDVAVVPELKAALARAARKPGEIQLIAFSAATLEAAQRALPQHAAFLLASYKPDPKTGRPPQGLDDLSQICKTRGFDGLSLDSRWPIDAAAVKRLHDAGLKCQVWTVDDAARARALAAAGVDGITTNRPGWLREQLAR
jgi:glycerophosphoryl diester phosphodiesterase